MKRKWLSRGGSASITVVFGGWAVGAAAFNGLQGKGSVLLVEDYTQLDDPIPELAQYDEVSVVAFSFGVASAAHWMARIGFKPTRKIAISGTLMPADCKKGIAPTLIRSTADNLSADSFSKFCLRAGLKSSVPAIDIAAARAELHAIIERGSAPETRFDRIWIPLRDRIIPSRAQKLAWASQLQAVRHVSGPHIPFGQGQSWAEWIS
ncbi:pimeloyl-ACP methyl esterase BioG family protein [Ruegeria arenilitoris]|uniref:pimeloyl-ACP methyl esterase BioG family protein n=1 Tax=Ruegeria arenilitoris TaxID=1173585 RepID=UPI00147EFECC|nr:pimeloyl-ACP methyl esterase BioG family protein [Ruegeria arenilitoris]